MSPTILTNVNSIFRGVGVQDGDVVLLHSDMGILARWASTQELKGHTNAGDYILSQFHLALRDLLGSEGTVCVLGAFTDYARFNRTFDIKTSPPDKDLGAYNSFLFRQDSIARSLNPLVGLIAQGKDAEFICEHRSANGFGILSPWERLVELDAIMVFWGVSLDFMTFVHHIEQLVGVPHTYNKIFSAPVHYNGKAMNFPVITNLRFLKGHDCDFKVVYNLSKFTKKLEESGVVRTHIGEGITTSAVRCRDVLKHLVPALAADPFYLLDSPPEFRLGRIPMDGPAGALDVTLKRIEEGGI